MVEEGSLFNELNRTNIVPAEKRVRILFSRSHLGGEQQIQKEGQAAIAVEGSFQG